MVFTVNVEFSGGLEILFDHKKKQKVVLEHIGDDGVLPLRDLLEYMRDNLLTDRPELFMQQDTVRPGILVLINDVDWELEGGVDSEIANVFIVFIKNGRMFTSGSSYGIAGLAKHVGLPRTSRGSVKSDCWTQFGIDSAWVRVKSALYDEVFIMKSAQLYTPNA